MTSHPKDLSDELIEVMKESKKICPHFHLPLQSGSSAILKKMNRHYTKERYLELVRKLRAALPDISLTTDIIVGFPGETEEDFLETMEVVKEVQYDSAFTFIYSKRTGTPAAVMENQIPDDVVKDRFDRLLAEVQEISRERCARFEGQTMDVLVEDVNDHDPSLVTGRLTNNLLVHFKGTEDLIGKSSMHLDECRGFYYMGTMISRNKAKKETNRRKQAYFAFQVRKRRGTSVFMNIRRGLCSRRDPKPHKRRVRYKGKYPKNLKKSTKS